MTGICYEIKVYQPAVTVQCLFVILSEHPCVKTVSSCRKSVVLFQVHRLSCYGERMIDIYPLLYMIGLLFVVNSVSVHAPHRLVSWLQV